MYSINSTAESPSPSPNFPPHTPHAFPHAPAHRAAPTPPLQAPPQFAGYPPKHALLLNTHYYFEKLPLKTKSSHSSPPSSITPLSTHPKAKGEHGVFGGATRLITNSPLSIPCTSPSPSPSHSLEEEEDKGPQPLHLTLGLPTPKSGTPRNPSRTSGDAGLLTGVSSVTGEGGIAFPR
ncbi:uncharacterized protein EAF02_003021 [Botrytis sinoallii]|uniref:uncharacterized protein n=1 Tax=Botrytis sinoallii TaxID=1463999 RepID=UPI00190171E7|nr:uncharacterized protein EAF02_003021 [Botrytis sinoallii]KAF7888480.1 hypothetical protein EAF02_003021 [Botrytis sinoallii]